MTKGAPPLVPSAARPWRTWLLILCAVAASALFYPQFSLSHDVSWYLVATRRFMDGARLYVDVIEINPPLAFYLTVPGLALADGLGLTPEAGFVLYVSLLGGAAAWWTLRLVERADIDARLKLIFPAAALVGAFLLPIGEFGQREHLMLILAMPYCFYLVLRDHLRPISVAERVGLGFAACLGLALKPYFLLIPFGILVARLAASRRWRELFDPAQFALGGGLIAYVLFIRFMHPEYLIEIVPVAREVYGSYGSAAARVLLRPEFLSFLVLTVLARVAGSRSDFILLGLMGATLGAFVAYAVQFKGWNYHMLPGAFFLLLSLGVIAAGPRSGSMRWSHRLAIIIAVYLAIGPNVQHGPYRAQTTEAFGAFVDRPHRSILVLSTNVWAAFPFVNEVQGQWASRFPAQWYIPGAVQRRAASDCRTAPDLCARLDAILDKARTAIIEDLLRYRPDHVFIDARAEKSYFGSVDFDYRVFLSRDPRFADIWADYRPMGEVGEYEVWALRDPERRKAS